MKFRAWHLYLIIVGIGALIGMIMDNYIVNGVQSAIDPYFHLGYNLGVTTFYGGILLVFYYGVVWYYRQKTKSKSYI